MDKQKMIARAVKLGDNEAEATRRIEELIQAHDGDNLAYALHHEGFIALVQYERMCGVRA